MTAIQFHEEPVSQIWDRLYVGCYYDAEQLNHFNPHRIDFVVNCTPDRVEHRNGIQSVVLGLEDGHPVPIDTLITALQAIRRAMAYDKTVLVHCHAGMSRAPSITAAYMYSAGFKSFDDFVQYIKDRRPIIKPHFEITNSIKRLLGIWPYGKDGLK